MKCKNIKFKTLSLFWTIFFLCGGIVYPVQASDLTNNKTPTDKKNSFQVSSLSSGVLSAGGEHTCLIDKGRVRCWGNNYKGQTKVPKLVNPRIVSAGGEHTCAIDDSGIVCWGNNAAGQLRVPKLNNPKNVSAGKEHTCAIDDEGVKCWGSDKKGQTKVPKLDNPRIVSAGGEHTCAIDDNGIVCWGNNEAGQIRVPTLKNPKIVSAGDSHTCAIDEAGVKCWGGAVEQSEVPALRNPKIVSSGGGQSCAIDEEGMKCWGDNRSGENFVDMPKLRNPSVISAGGYHTCAKDVSGVKCWGSNDSFQSQSQNEVIKDLFKKILNLKVSERKYAISKLGLLLNNKSLSKENTEKIILKLVDKLSDSSDDARFLSVQALGSYAEESSNVSPLVSALLKEDKEVRENASRLIGELGKKAIPALINALSDQDPKAKKIIADELGLLGIADPEVSSALTLLLKDKDPIVRLSSAIALTWLGANPSMANAELGQLASNPSSEISVKAKKAMEISKLNETKLDKKSLEKKEADPIIGLWFARYESHAQDGYFEDYVQIWKDSDGRYRGIKWSGGVYTGYRWYPERFGSERIESVSSIFSAKTGLGVLRLLGLKKKEKSDVLENITEDRGYEVEYERQSKTLENECQTRITGLLARFCSIPEINAKSIEIAVLERKFEMQRGDLVFNLENKIKENEFMGIEEEVPQSEEDTLKVIKVMKRRLQSLRGSRQWRLQIRESCADISCVTSAFEKRVWELRKQAGN